MLRINGLFWNYVAFSVWLVIAIKGFHFSWNECPLKLVIMNVSVHAKICTMSASIMLFDLLKRKHFHVNEHRYSPMKVCFLVMNGKRCNCIISYANPSFRKRSRAYWKYMLFKFMLKNFCNLINFSLTV